jgi:hypothetical protein
VVFVAFPGSRTALRPLINTLRSDGTNYRVIEVEDTSVFIATSGIGYFPIVMLVDPDNRIRMVVNELTEGPVSVLTELLLSRSEEAARTTGGPQ